MKYYVVVGTDDDCCILYGWSLFKELVTQHTDYLLMLQVDTNLQMFDIEANGIPELVDVLVSIFDRFDRSNIFIPDPPDMYAYELQYRLFENGSSIVLTISELSEILDEIEELEEFVDDYRSIIIQMIYLSKFLHPEYKFLITEALKPFIGMASVLGNLCNQYTGTAEKKKLTQVLNPLAIFAFKNNLL